MKTLRNLVVAALALCAFAAPATATVVTVTPSNTQGWSINAPGENSSSGSAAITSTDPRSGNGSLHVNDDRSRTVLGSLYSPFSNLGLFADVASVAVDWTIDANSSRLDYSPDFGVDLYNFSTSKRSRLVCEAAYNGGSAGLVGAWQTISGCLLWEQIAGASGPTLSGGSLVTQSITAWQTQYANDLMRVIGYELGQGGGATLGYSGALDNFNVTLKDGTSTTFNFELDADAVPEPAMLGLFGLGAVGLGYTRRRKHA